MALLQTADKGLAPENAFLLIKMADGAYQFLTFAAINKFLSFAGEDGLKTPVEALPDLQTPDEIIPRDTADFDHRCVELSSRGIRWRLFGDGR